MSDTRIPELTGRAARRLVAVLLLVAPLEQIGLDIYTPALPKMAAAFSASNALVQNTVTAYMLGLTLVVLPVGLLTDAIGRKRVLLTGLSVMALAGFGSALAANLPQLIALRFIQGAGAGTCLLLAAAIAADCFRGAKLVSVLGTLGAAWGAAPVVAPAIGGFVVQGGSWRLVFVVLGLICATVALLVAAYLPETLAEHRRSPVDLRAAAGVLSTALRHRAFIGFAVSFGLVAAAQMVFGVVGPFLYQAQLGFAPAAYGLIALAVGGTNFAGAALCGVLAQRTTTRRLALAAAGVLGLGGVVLVASAEALGVTGLCITAGAALALLGVGVLDPLTKGMAMNVFTRNVGLITGLISTACYLSITLAMALMAYLPERSQAPLGWFYIAAAALIAVLLVVSIARLVRTPSRAEPQPAVAVCA